MVEEHQPGSEPNYGQVGLGLLDLPVEVLLMIVGWLGVKSLLCLERTCPTLLRVCRDRAIWRSLGLRRFVDFESSLLAGAARPILPQEHLQQTDTTSPAAQHRGEAVQRPAAVDQVRALLQQLVQLSGDDDPAAAADHLEHLVKDVSPRDVVLRLRRAETVETVLDLTIMIDQWPTTLRSMIETSVFTRMYDSARPLVVGKVAAAGLSAKTISRVIYVAISRGNAAQHDGPFVTVVGRWFDGGWFRHTCLFNNGKFVRWGSVNDTMLSSSRSVVMKGQLTIANDRAAPWTVVYATRLQKYRKYM
eukprot:TRINITY_DN9512_c0_g1_i3.p1 TRINITY_DN9512_c0_g1~~TRINITY_DN9512_c0_g1_i3.p1  ORF type:complete len:304 (+),score=34.33 TRINITY_DN9512_c0_g1_i3:156-1067(+)